MKLEIDIPYYVFEQIKRENTIKNVLNRIDFAIRNGEERPHGEWIEHRTHTGYFVSEYECSNCHDDVWQKTEWQFCPNCGASMAKEGEEK